MERLKKAKLFVQPKKCEFFKEEIDFLGHKICNREIRPKAVNTAKLQGSFEYSRTRLLLPKVRAQHRTSFGAHILVRKHQTVRMDRSVQRVVQSNQSGY